MIQRTLIAFALLLVGVGTAWSQTPRDTQVRADRQEFADDANWIYNDLEAGIAAARAAKKPLFVVFRCIPCEACAGFDDRVANLDPAIRELLTQFVCVRVPQANTIDLSKFQFDFDLSLGAFFMNADGTLYGRFGTPTEREDEENDESVAALNKALQSVLELHAGYPANRALLTGKQSSPLRIGRATFRTPREFPSLVHYQVQLDWAGAVTKSCVHCHQIHDAQRLVYRNAGQPIPDHLIYPWPMPETVGLTLDPASIAHVAAVAKASLAEQAGFRVGDDIQTLDGQSIVSVADVQWVLHNAGTTGRLAATVERDGATEELTLQLTPGWRSQSDNSWRVGRWDLRRIALGGLTLEPVADDQRSSLGIADGQMALRVKTMGQYNQHATAKKAGFLVGDIIVSFAGQTDLLSEMAIMAYAAQNTRIGQRAEVIVVRNGRPVTIMLPMQ